jgi:septation ring formation regulator EzrA
MTDEIDEIMRACLHRFEAKLDLMTDLMQSLEVRFGALENRYSAVEERIAGVECSEERIVTVENRVSALDQHMTSIHLDDHAIRKQLDQILVRLQRLERRAGLLEDETDQ